MTHPMLTLVAALDAAVDEVAGVDPIYMTVPDKKATLTGVARARARLEAVELKVLAASDDIAEATGDRSTASWLANQTREAHGTVRRKAVLARALASRWAQTADALEAGQVNLAQARVIAEALEALPQDLSGDLLLKAEGLLVEEAAKLGPKELAVLGGRVLERLAPDIAEEAEYQRLLAAERRANAATKLNLRRRGDGSTDIHARIPDHAAGRLRAYLNAFTAPRRRHLQDQQTVETPFGPLTPPAEDEFANLPIERQRGIAFVAFLENTLSSDLPRHGGGRHHRDGHHPVRQPRRDVDKAGIATTSTGERITAGEGRRLGCQAQILPAVMGGGVRGPRPGPRVAAVQATQRKAMNLRDKECTTVGCSVPAEFCEAHHKVPWSRGGNTDLEDGKLLCPFHHHRAHDPGWITHHHPNGSTTFTRRQ